MPAVGYPDYTRLSRGGVSLFYSNNGVVPENTILFRGYVGLWPYTNIAVNCNASADFCKILVQYYDDSTFTNQVGFRYLIRQGSNFSITQYENLSEWMLVFYLSQSGANFPFLFFTISGTTSRSAPLQLASNEIPLIGSQPTVAAATTLNIVAQRVVPGPARMLITSGATSWSIKFRFYEYISNSIITIFTSNTFAAPGVYESDWPMIDAPMTVGLTNNDAAAKSFTVAWLSEAS